MNQKMPGTQPGSAPLPSSPALKGPSPLLSWVWCLRVAPLCTGRLSLICSHRAHSLLPPNVTPSPKGHIHLLPARHLLIQPKVPVSQEREFDCPVWSLLGQCPPPECRCDHRGPVQGGGQFSGTGCGLGR